MLLVLIAIPTRSKVCDCALFIVMAKHNLTGNCLLSSGFTAPVITIMIQDSRIRYHRQSLNYPEFKWQLTLLCAGHYNSGNECAATNVTSTKIRLFYSKSHNVYICISNLTMVTSRTLSRASRSTRRVPLQRPCFGSRLRRSISGTPGFKQSACGGRPDGVMLLSNSGG